MKDKTKRLENQALSSEHLKILRGDSGISDEVIAARGYRTIIHAAELEKFGFALSQRRVPGLLLPLHGTDGSNSLYVYRPDNPRETRSGKGKAYQHNIIKYEVPKGHGIRLDCPPTCQKLLHNPEIPLWITEGQKKADALASRKQCAIALLGVWNWKGRNAFGGTTLLNDFDYIALDGRDVRIVFDSDVMSKSEVRQALDRLKEHLERKKSHVYVVYLPKREDGKNGVDDYLAGNHTIEDLLTLLDAPRPLPQPAAPIVELLDSAPAILRRPLALIDGHAFAATWPYAKVTKTESVDKAGEIVKHDPPVVKKEQRLFVIRDDGKIFGDGKGCEPVSDLGLEIHLPEIPHSEKLWSTVGIKAYLSGRRPDPCDVFTRVGAVINQFIDFDRSLATQNIMSEMLSCYILATWFLDAFNVIGFLWPNGDRGSGKTQLLTVVAELSYLGQVILAGGSYASLRDLADYGATLAFDDAENLANPKRTDPDKRALLLAGNRRGNVVSVKEQVAKGVWKTRFVNTFCPRLFSAIQIPDPVLSSRTIIVPLVRTPDRIRANADPLDYKLWPFDRRQLIADLWAVALSHLKELPRYESLVNSRARLTGRNLEPWRAILAVALFLEEKGIENLFRRLEKLSFDYQEERSDLEVGDLTVLVIHGLCHCAISAKCAISGETPKEFIIETQQVTDAVLEIVKNGEVDIEEKRVTNKTVGRVLGKLRLREVPRPGGKGSRKRRLTLSDLAGYVNSYGLPLPEALEQNEQN